MKFRFDGAGDVLVNKPKQNIVFILREKPHAQFQRDGDDLVYKCCAPLRLALCGYRPKIPTLGDGSLEVNVSGPIHPGSTRRLPGYGMFSRILTTNGDMMVRFEVDFPSDLTAEQKAEFDRLLSE
mmetsp:Transcript_23189/g.57605  ORF Transcript_23189/g.57605 Transcript_23189/m.57605 type:complete len:125 (-) Transcript_23189:92-466(-)